MLVHHPFCFYFFQLVLLKTHFLYLLHYKSQIFCFREILIFQIVEIVFWFLFSWEVFVLSNFKIWNCWIFNEFIIRLLTVLVIFYNQIVILSFDKWIFTFLIFLLIIIEKDLIAVNLKKFNLSLNHSCLQIQIHYFVIYLLFQIN